MLGAAHSSINKHSTGKADVSASASSWNRIAGSARLHPLLQTLIWEVSVGSSSQGSLDGVAAGLPGRITQLVLKQREVAECRAGQEETLLDYL